MQTETETFYINNQNETENFSFNEEAEQQQQTVCLAVWNNNLKVLEKLVEQVRRGEKMAGYGPTHFAASLGNVDILELLLIKGLDKNERDEEGNSPMIWVVVADGNEDLLDALIDHGANIDLQNFVGETALFLACQRGLVNKVEYLLENGAKVHVANLDGASPLHAAAAIGNLTIINLLVKYGAHLNVGDDEGDTPLHWAVREGHTEAALLLVQRGADLSARNEDGETVLDLALSWGDEQIVKRLSFIGTKLLTVGSSRHELELFTQTITRTDVDMLDMSLDMKSLSVKDFEELQRTSSFNNSGSINSSVVY